MKATTVKYERLINTGNFSHEVVGITLAIEEGEKALDVLNKAKDFVDRATKVNVVDSPREKYLEIVSNPRQYLYTEVEDAREWLDNNPVSAEVDDDLPF